MKALATTIALIIFLVILLSVLIPAFFILYNTPYYSDQGNIAAQAYQEEKDLQLNNIFNGNPLIYYSSGTSPYVEIKVKTVQTPINITQIYYFNGTMWVPALNNSINVDSSMIIPLPKAAFNEPIVIVTGMSNILYLNPNTSVTISAVAVYYLVMVYNSFSLPKGVQLISNSYPVLGDIAAQLLQASVIPPKGSGVPSQVLALGPIKDYTYEMLYLPSGTNITVTIFYLYQIVGKYTLSSRPLFQVETFQSLLSEPQYFVVENATYILQGNYYVYCYNPNQNAYLPSIFVYSPTMITVYSVWEYGGNPP